MRRKPYRGEPPQGPRGRKHPLNSEASTTSYPLRSQTTTDSRTQAASPKTAKPSIIFIIKGGGQKPTTTKPKKKNTNERYETLHSKARCKHHPLIRTNERTKPGPNRGAGTPPHNQRDETINQRGHPKVQRPHCPKASHKNARTPEGA